MNEPRFTENATMPPAVVRMPANQLGRDFVMGDLHGEVGQLKRRLTELGFDGRVDRLFSVGDLIDRGKDSLAALRLLQEPWFFAVLGNHERMMLEYLFEPEKPNLWLENGGDWHQSVDWAQLLELAQLVRQLPLIRIVGEGQNRFQLVHAQMPEADQFLDRELGSDDIEFATWSRQLIRAAEAFQIYHGISEPVGRPVSIEEVENLPHYQPIDIDHALTFCGHSVIPRPMLWRSHYLLDTGAGWPDGIVSVVNVYKALAHYKHFERVSNASSKRLGV